MDVAGKKVTVVGLGQTAVSVVRLLLREGARPFVTDSGNGPKLTPYCEALDALGVPYETGGHSEAAFEDAAVVIPSPGVSPTLAPIEAARARGSVVVGEMEFAFGYCRSRLIAVTGTNGKTTTTELLRALVAACGHSVVLAGNNAFPFSAAVMIEPAPEYIVLEVSSYQLETARTFRPWIAAVLNVTPDHLARHGTVEGYAAIKARIFARQESSDIAVVNFDDPYVRGMAACSRGVVWPFSVKDGKDGKDGSDGSDGNDGIASGLYVRGGEICLGDAVVARVGDTRLPGRHNLANVLAALSVMRAGGFDWDKTLEGLRGFRGVEHRIELVASLDGVDFFNDSKSTNIDSLKVALESFERPVVLIAGGQGKGSDYGVIRELVRQRVRKLIVIGEDAAKLDAAFGDVVGVEQASDMDDAVRRAAGVARAGDVVLLSPACASFDMFDNFEHRGRVFKAGVEGLKGGKDAELVLGDPRMRKDSRSCHG